jgi:hypothetical protein
MRVFSRRARQCHRRLVHLDRGLERVHFRAADVVVGEQLAAAVAQAAAAVEVGLGLRQLGAVHGVVQHQQLLPAAHRRAFLQADARHATGNLGTQHDRLVGAQRADGGDLLRQRPHRDRLGLDRNRSGLGIDRGWRCRIGRRRAAAALPPAVDPRG